MLDVSDLVVFAAPQVVSATTLSAMHWFPWHGGQRKPGRVAAYAMGTAVTMGVPVATMLLTVATGNQYGTLFWAALIVANTLVSGATVAVAYWIDSRRPVGEAEVRDAAHGR
jgi:hypothetical protein